MNECREWRSRLVENARAGSGPDASLREHVEECPACAARWRDERVLTRELQILSDRAAIQRDSRAGLDNLLDAFDRRRRAGRRHWLRWIAVPAAAVVLLAGFLITRDRQTPPQVVQASVTEDGFTIVPYAPPLAPGELVSVVREDLDAEALVRMGLPGDGFDDQTVAADVLVGEDGFPRAVRVAEDSELSD